MAARCSAAEPQAARAPTLPQVAMEDLEAADGCRGKYTEGLGQVIDARSKGGCGALASLDPRRHGCA